MLREIRDLGFDYAELSHGIRISLLPGLLEAVDAGEIKISSVHNFCPLPVGVDRAAPNLYQFTASGERERELAVKHTLRTLEFASRVKAPLVVLHLGSVEMKHYTEKLKESAVQGANPSPRYAKLLAEAVQKRDAKKAKAMERLQDSLRRILPEAESRGLKLGCENREALEELPADGDFVSLFSQLQSSALTYWHDTGHAQIKEHLGLIRHADHLGSYADRLAGFHIHDVQFPAQDHCPPGTGKVDFASLKPFVKPTHIKVFEFGPHLTSQQVHNGIDYVRSIWG